LFSYTEVQHSKTFNQIKTSTFVHLLLKELGQAQFVVFFVLNLLPKFQSEVMHEYFYMFITLYYFIISFPISPAAAGSF